MSKLCQFLADRLRPHEACDDVACTGCRQAIISGSPIVRFVRVKAEECVQNFIAHQECLLLALYRQAGTDPGIAYDAESLEAYLDSINCERV